MPLLTRTMVIDYVSSSLGWAKEHESDIEVEAYDKHDTSKRVRLKLPGGTQVKDLDEIQCTFIDEDTYNRSDSKYIPVIQIHSTDVEGKPTKQILLVIPGNGGYRIVADTIPDLILEIIVQEFLNTGFATVANILSISPGQVRKAWYFHQKPGVLPQMFSQASCSR